MAYRERIAWLEMFGMTLSYGAYFVAVAMAVAPTMLGLLALFAAASALRLIVLGIVRLVFIRRWPSDARAPADEWDRSIARRSAAIAYYVLMAGMIVVGMIMPFGYSGWAIVNAALVAIVLAEMVSCAITVLSYRRGWHG